LISTYKNFENPLKFFNLNSKYPNFLPTSQHNLKSLNPSKFPSLAKANPKWAHTKCRQAE
jgi:hypothetical protein